MKAAILCLCLAGTACALPFQYLPHYTGSRPRTPAIQMKAPFTGGFPQGAFSLEFIPGIAGTNQPQTFPQYGFIKYSIPQPPGRQSVEVFYPYDFTQNKLPLFGLPPQATPQQTVNMPTFDVNALPSQDPMPQLQHDQPVQTSQAPAKV